MQILWTVNSVLTVVAASSYLQHLSDANTMDSRPQAQPVRACNDFADASTVVCHYARLGSARLGSARLGGCDRLALGSARLGSARLFGSSSFCLNKRSQFVLATILQMQALWSVTMLGSAQLGSARLGSAAAIGSRSARLGSARLGSSALPLFAFTNVAASSCLQQFCRCKHCGLSTLIRSL